MRLDIDARERTIAALFLMHLPNTYFCNCYIVCFFLPTYHFAFTTRPAEINSGLWGSNVFLTESLYVVTKLNFFCMIFYSLFYCFKILQIHAFLKIPLDWKQNLRFISCFIFVFLCFSLH